jgi:cytochrome b pre-mRNA-processing protein 3
MIWPLTSRKRRPDTISTLYGMIVAQARLACFYRDYAVADTVNGRFDLIVLHLTLVLDRLSAEPALQGYRQGLFDRFCRDMDDNLREMGIGDLKVPTEMRRMGDAFYGRARTYRAAFAAGDSAAVSAALAEALARNVYAGSTEVGEAAPRRLAAYMRRAVDDLKAQDAEMLAVGVMRFPDPSVISQQDGVKP